MTKPLLILNGKEIFLFETDEEAKLAYEKYVKANDTNVVQLLNCADMPTPAVQAIQQNLRKRLPLLSKEALASLGTLPVEDLNNLLTAVKTALVEEYDQGVIDGQDESYPED